MWRAAAHLIVGGEGWWVECGVEWASMARINLVAMLKSEYDWLVHNIFVLVVRI